MMLAIAVLIAAGYGMFFLWTGTLPAHTFKVIGSYGILTLIVFVVTLITKPAGEKH
eukprot:CAMPEP_0184461562 /NCGR_PEP_ID=MMETSP0740-20130409/44968_1 /TAXON_ID=385413 /ORGANISM="Thalassiosira miniscula, Strain CCMP1093" /LENGTH=55 /DNA_ID=CAMNT_0026835227 /DNA_START=111 /DNA_END=278 /DNA_ORIENTATION=+